MPMLQLDALHLASISSATIIGRILDRAESVGRELDVCLTRVRR